jgi:hypothetical protein
MGEGFEWAVFDSVRYLASESNTILDLAKLQQLLSGGFLSKRL